MPRANSLPTLAVAFAAMLWGSDLLLRPNALAAGWSPARVVLGEHLFLTLAFAVPLWRGRRDLRRLTRREWGALLFIAWGGSALATVLYTKAFTLGSPLTAVLLQKTQPVFAIALAGGLLHERRTAFFWVWGVLALVGACLLTGLTRPLSLSDIPTRQAVYALGAAALWGAATVAGRSLTPTLPPRLLAGARFALAVPVLALLSLLPSASAPVISGQTNVAWLCLLLIVLLPDWAGMTLYYRGLRGTPASVATLAELCYPLTSLVIGICVQHARLMPGQWVGLALLMAAVLRLGRTPGVVAGRGARELQSIALS